MNWDYVFRINGLSNILQMLKNSMTTIVFYSLWINLCLQINSESINEPFPLTITFREAHPVQIVINMFFLSMVGLSVQ